MEQFEFTFSPDETASAAHGTNEEAWEKLSDAELEERYSKAVGINPALRGFDRKTIIEGLIDPAAELDRIRTLDADDDKREIKKTYAH